MRYTFITFLHGVQKSGAKSVLEGQALLQCRLPQMNMPAAMAKKKIIDT